MEDELRLEPAWNHVQVGDVVDFYGELIFFDEAQGKHLVRSMLHKAFIVVQGELQKGIAHSFLGATVTCTTQGIRIDCDAATILTHHVPKVTDLHNVIELCAGAGFLGEGLASAGYQVKVVNDLRIKNCEMYSYWREPDNPVVICGDISDTAVIKQIHEAHGSPALISFGFNCQPWSRLGDQGQLKDERAKSLISSLRASFWLRAHTVIMECVNAAGNDKQVRSIIRAFMKATGLIGDEVNLRLQTIMPAKRDRWWCLLHSPMVPQVKLRALPVLAQVPTVGDMIPVPFEHPLQESQQLALDLYETNKFEAYGGLASNFLTENQPAPTALHGWGNQLQACPCQCRQWPLTESRLQSKGLFGALLAIGGEFDTSSGKLPKTRHVHPTELAAINGVQANRSWGISMKLALAALGQMASPVRSCWIAGHLQQQVGVMMQSDVATPEMILWGHLSGVFQGIRIAQPKAFEHPRFQAYMQQVYDTLHPVVHPVPTTLLNQERNEKNEEPICEIIPIPKWAQSLTIASADTSSEPSNKKRKTEQPEEIVAAGVGENGEIFAFATTKAAPLPERESTKAMTTTEDDKVDRHAEAKVSKSDHDLTTEEQDLLQAARQCDPSQTPWIT